MKLSITCLCSALAFVTLAEETAEKPAESAERPAEPSAGKTQAQGRVKQLYSRYESIVDRQMFGPLPPGFDPEKMPNEVSKSEQKELTKEQEKLQSSIRFSMINVTPDGNTVVGFTDNSDPKVPVPMYLKVGESRNGWTVLEADPKTATMRISKGDIEVSLTIGGNSASDAAATSKTATSSAPAAEGGGRRGLGLLRSNTLRGRRARLEAQRQQEAAEEEKRRAEEKAAREEEKAQHEAEREEQRRALESLRDELKKQREEAAKAREEAKAANDSAQESSDENNAAE